MLAGHVGTRDGSGGHIFRDLQHLQPGDAVEIHTAQGVRHYVVAEILHVDADAVQVMAPSDREQVTLITCRLCNIDCDRLVVVAVPRSEDEPGEGSPVA